MQSYLRYLLKWNFKIQYSKAALMVLVTNPTKHKIMISLFDTFLWMEQWISL